MFGPQGAHSGLRLGELALRFLQEPIVELHSFLVGVKKFPLRFSAASSELRVEICSRLFGSVGKLLRLLLIVMAEPGRGLGNLVFEVGLSERRFLLDALQSQFVACPLSPDLFHELGGLLASSVQLSLGNNFEFCDLSLDLGAERVTFPFC